MLLEKQIKIADRNKIKFIMYLTVTVLSLAFFLFLNTTNFVFAAPSGYCQFTNRNPFDTQANVSVNPNLNWDLFCYDSDNNPLIYGCDEDPCVAGCPVSGLNEASCYFISEFQVRFAQSGNTLALVCTNSGSWGPAQQPSYICGWQNLDGGFPLIGGTTYNWEVTVSINGVNSDFS